MDCFDAAVVFIAVERLHLERISKLLQQLKALCYKVP